MHSPRSFHTKAPDILIRACHTPEEFKACVDIQNKVWRFDPLDAVSHHIMAVANETGGQVFGSFDGNAMIGFALSFPAIREGRVHLHSHMAAVLPGYQGRGIGRLLKLAQREDALVRGIDVIEWTFDPLQQRNANFNINHLGVVIRRYLPDFYGSSSSPLHANLPTDRVVAEWQLRSKRVETHISGHASPEAGHGLRVSFTRELDSWRREKPSRAMEIQTHIREQLLAAFAKGYVVTGFSTNDIEASYLLEMSNAN